MWLIFLHFTQFKVKNGSFEVLSLISQPFSAAPLNGYKFIANKTTFSIKKLDPSVSYSDDISGHCRHKGTSAPATLMTELLR
ncbi:MAG: hypothetical protein ACR5LA_05385 [Wolbachia sp.]